MLKYFRFVLFLTTLGIGFIKCPNNPRTSFGYSDMKTQKDSVLIDHTGFKEFLLDIAKGTPQGPIELPQGTEKRIDNYVEAIIKKSNGENAEFNKYEFLDFLLLPADHPRNSPGLKSVLSTGEYIAVKVDDVRTEMLERHNTLRGRHGLELLTLDPDLNVAAQNWADKIAQEKNDRHHDLCRAYGQNIWSIRRRVPNMGLIATDVWYSGVGELNETEDNSTLDKKYAKIVSAVQILYNKSTKLGVGMARDEDGKYYVVAHYLEAIISDRLHDCLPEIRREDIALGKTIIEHYLKIANINITWNKEAGEPNSYEKAMAYEDDAFDYSQITPAPKPSE